MTKTTKYIPELFYCNNVHTKHNIQTKLITN